MRFTTIFVCALVCLLVVSINGDADPSAISDSSANEQSINNSEDSSSSSPDGETLDNELAEWFENQPIQFVK